MYMPYTKNPYLPKVRREATNLVASGWSMRQTARHFGVEPSTIMRWVRRGALYHGPIATMSARPKHHPQALPYETVRAIVEYRQKYRRCAEVLQYLLMKDGLKVSLSSVKRTLSRNGFGRSSPWKKWHQYPPRPAPETPGTLVEIDTVWDGVPEGRLYLYTLLDVCSRWAYAIPCLAISTHRSLRFVEQARVQAPFPFSTLQSDHGSEFSKWFTKRITERGMAHRHSRVRQPNDNAHLERFNRTIQDECLKRLNRSLKAWRTGIPEYLHYYNTERPHMALGMKSPLQVLPSS